VTSRSPGLERPRTQLADVVPLHCWPWIWLSCRPICAPADARHHRPVAACGWRASAGLGCPGPARRVRRGLFPLCGSSRRCTPGPCGMPSPTTVFDGDPTMAVAAAHTTHTNQPCRGCRGRGLSLRSGTSSAGRPAPDSPALRGGWPCRQPNPAVRLGGRRARPSRNARGRAPSRVGGGRDPESRDSDGRRAPHRHAPRRCRSRGGPPMVSSSVMA